MEIAPFIVISDPNCCVKDSTSYWNIIIIMSYLAPIKPRKNPLSYLVISPCFNIPLFITSCSFTPCFITPCFITPFFITARLSLHVLSLHSTPSFIVCVVVDSIISAGKVNDCVISGLC